MKNWLTFINRLEKEKEKQRPYKHKKKNLFSSDQINVNKQIAVIFNGESH